MSGNWRVISNQLFHNQEILIKRCIIEGLFKMNRIFSYLKN